MPRLSTRVMRKMGMTNTHVKHRYWKGTTPGRQRMKSFATEEAARNWAKAEKLDDKTHELRRLPGGKWQWRTKNPRLA